MLSSSNDQLVSREPALPGLAILLNAERFARLWAIEQSLPQRPAATMQYVRYKPGRRCIAVYLMSTDSTEYQVVVTAFNRDGWHKHIHTFDGTTCDTNPHRDTDLTDAWISVATFPRDRKIRLLEAFRHPDETRNFVRSFVNKQIDDDHFRVQCVAYKPGRRAVFDVQTSSDHRYAVKVIESSEFEQARRPAEAWEHIRWQLSDRRVELPELIRADQKRRILVSRWLKGRNLAEQMSSVLQSESDPYFRVGTALGELHRSEPAGLIKSRDTVLNSPYSRLASDVATLVPSLSKNARFFANEIEKRIAVHSHLQTPIHGDFYAKQICVDDHSIGILDFDQSRYGSPLQDVGNFIAKVIWNSYRGDFTADQVAEIEDAFRQGYISRCGDLDEAAVELQVAAGLFKCMTHPFRSGMDNWHDHIANILELVSERFERHRTDDRLTPRDSTNAKRPSTALNKSPAPSMFKQQLLRDVPTTWMANALICERARERILRCCPEFSGLDERLVVDHIEPVQVKAGRRCLIRYDLRVAQSQSPDQKISILGKLRFKGVDRHGYSVQQQLHKQGFNELNPNGVSVPRTLGIDPETRIWYQACVPGRSLEQLVASQEETIQPEASKRIAEALATLHCESMIRRCRAWTIDDEVQSLTQRLQSVACKHPGHKAAIGKLIDLANRLSRWLVKEPSVVIHRDFHPSQILLTDEKLYLLDFDLCSYGPAALDAGNFLAHLWELSIRCSQQSSIWMNEATKFLESYQQTLSPGEPIPCNLNAWSWLAFVRHVWISTQISDRAATTGAVIEKALEMVDDLSSS
ncbi:phosphotransferase [Stieleria varia]|uniref:Methylthioribose kinase n=1 Tax=Stieleria varia TaxID=2528005 RepID=A0A5C6B2R8_9BACT|nr:phosphotransferase [Stieleria varia]TWU06190.1 methylthioribose kinase [Stieleria varia]